MILSLDFAQQILLRFDFIQCYSGKAETASPASQGNVM
jgi:hypothetical protein